ncbi:Odorant receptor 85b [Frankliniella fusca]|uniref:Odorant receptor 85b n=1 Tax=Frankliniella fusca TaxID=407009 RepID=A0AAE1LIA2_9NEOP|nr:Odorant receptor 85b [Frankliniella fusca]
MASTHKYGGSLEKWALPQSKLIAASLLMRNLFYYELPQVLISTIIVPLFAMEDVVVNGSQADRFSLTIVIWIIIGLIPVCEYGESMVGQRRGLQTAMYFGPWLEEPVRMQRGRLCFALASYGKRGYLSGPILGVFCRRTLGNIVLQWFKFLQALLNIQER